MAGKTRPFCSVEFLDLLGSFGGMVLGSMASKLETAED